jgi:hypothetical protein
MPDESPPPVPVTLVLDGDPTLDDLSSALVGLRDLLGGIAQQVAQGVEITWAVAGLEGGSAVATFAGSASDQDAVRRVARAYIDVGAGTHEGRSPFPVPAVQVPTQRLLQIINGRVPSIRFETADDDVTLVSGDPRVSAPVAPVISISSYGAATGRVQTLSSRGSLRFTLYDLVEDKAISCYLRPGQEDIMRDAWGHVATVEGRIKRDPVTGRIQSVRDITNVTVLKEGTPGAWRQAEGVLKGVGPDEPAEVTVRRLRDA